MYQRLLGLKKKCQGWNIYIFLFWIGVLFGVFLRVYKFDLIPSGLNQDEISAGYEAWSLAATGKDRWGNDWPVYFVSWGSGQNTLYSYITAVFFKFFGVNSLVLRLPNLLMSLALIPLSFSLLKTFTNKNLTGYLAAFIVALDPFLILTSRWTMDVNFTPFMVTLALYFLAKGLHVKSTKIFKILTFLPLALLFYTYGTLTFVLPLFVFLTLFLYIDRIKPDWKLYGFSFLGFLLLLIPYTLFILKNNLGITFTSLESVLPITITKLVASRVEINGSEFWEIAKSNFTFLWDMGLSDNNIYNTPHPYSAHVFYLIQFGFLVFVCKIFRQFIIFYKQLKFSGNILFNFFFSQKPSLSQILTIWTLSFLPLFIIVRVNGNRANALTIAILFFAAIGLAGIFMKLKVKFEKYSKFFNGIVIFIIFLSLVQGLRFGGYYFQDYKQRQAKSFNYGFAEMIQKSKELNDAQSIPEKVVYTNEVSFSYLYVAFYTGIEPAEFQKSNWEQVGTGFKVYNLGNYYSLESLQNAEFDFADEASYLLIIKNSKDKPCTDHTEILIKGDFGLYRCYNFEFN